MLLYVDVVLEVSVFFFVLSCCGAASWGGSLFYPFQDTIRENPFTLSNLVTFSNLSCKDSL